MSTIIRPEVSKKNQYWIERHRYYELKHFCLQYPLWKKAYAAIDGLGGSAWMREAVRSSGVSDPTAKAADLLIFYSDKIRLVEEAAEKTDPELARYILKGVTEEMAYDYLRLQFGIPCCKDIYYDVYRRFFWLLDKTRN